MDQELRDRIEKALDNIRPYLEADGGNVRIVGMKKNTLILELLGNCGSCPMSSMTLKAGVEEAIIRAVPEISKVDAINAVDPGDPNAKVPSMAN